MKNIFLLLAFSLLVSCGDDDQDNNNNLNCAEYWAAVTFSNFCGLTESNFDFNTIPQDICNADQNDSYSFDDLVSIRVFNHFSNSNAREEYDAEENDSQSLSEYVAINNLGDDAFALLSTEFGELDFAIVQVVKGTFTVYLEVNGNAVNGANNCFDENSVVEFARALVNPL
jgi:hypothetical protein